MISSDAETSDLTDTLEATFERFTPPRLSIAHLLIWTAIAAMLLKLNLATGYLGKLMGPQFQEIPHIAIIIESNFVAISDMMFAAGLLGTVVIVVDQMRGSKGRLQPGHWLMIAYTFSAIVQMGSQYLRELVICICGEYLFDSPYLKTFTLIVTTVFVVRLVGSTGIYLWAAFRCKGGRHWTTALCLLPAIVLFHAGLKTVLARLLSAQSLGKFFMIMSYTSLIMPGLVVIGAVVIDLFNGRRRDWLHWTGVGIVVVPMLLAIGRLAVYLVFYIA